MVKRHPTWIYDRQTRREIVQRILDLMSLPNLLTLSRIPFLFLIAGCMFLPSPGPTFAFVFFLIAAFTDWLDGWLARKIDSVSDFGKLMDALTDKILMVGLFVSLLALDILPTWSLFFLLLILAREFWITGLRLVAAAKGIVLAAENLGKWKTVFQMSSIGFLLIYLMLLRDIGMEEDSFWVVAVFASGVITFLIASLLTAVSGSVYLWKYRSLLLK